MISAVILFGATGDILLTRYFRNDITPGNIEAFKLDILQNKGPSDKKQNGSPIVTVDRANFMYIRSGSIYLCAASSKNSDVTMVFQWLYSLVDVLKSYTGDRNLDQNSVKNNAFIIYELLDEMLDHGYPQICAAETLKEYIRVGKVQLDPAELERTRKTITRMVTGAVDWRDPNKYKYRKNEVYIDVLEKMHVVVSKGNVLNSYVTGKLVMKTILSGFPTCTFGLNDKIANAANATNPSKNSRRKDINIDQLRFHRCVKLAKFDADRCISFVPPDGEFDLATYRIGTDIRLPFHVHANIIEKGRARVEYEIQVKSAFDPKTCAQDVVIKLPCPPNTAKTTFKATEGKTKYEPKKHTIEWRVKKFPGGSVSYRLKGEVKRSIGITDKQWARPPITLEFTIPMWTASDLQVRYLKVQEPSNYSTTKWVRYIAKAGLYEIRI